MSWDGPGGGGGGGRGLLLFSRVAMVVAGAGEALVLYSPLSPFVSFRVGRAVDNGLGRTWQWICDRRGMLNFDLV